MKDMKGASEAALETEFAKSKEQLNLCSLLLKVKGGSKITVLLQYADFKRRILHSFLALEISIKTDFKFSCSSNWKTTKID